MVNPALMNCFTKASKSAIFPWYLRKFFMPIIKSAIKRAKQAITRRSRNLQVKRAVKQDVATLHAAITAGDSKLIESSLSAAYSEIDRAVRKHTLHKNTASNADG